MVDADDLLEHLSNTKNFGQYSSQSKFGLAGIGQRVSWDGLYIGVKQNMDIGIGFAGFL
jgi:hypothetical protein